MNYKELTIQSLDENIGEELKQLIKLNSNKEGGEEIIQKELMRLVEAKKILISAKGKEKKATKVKTKKKGSDATKVALSLGAVYAVASLAVGFANKLKTEKRLTNMETAMADQLVAQHNSSSLALGSTIVVTNLLGQVLGAQSIEDLTSNLGIGDEEMDELIEFCKSDYGKMRI